MKRSAMHRHAARIILGFLFYSFCVQAYAEMRTLYPATRNLVSKAMAIGGEVVALEQVEISNRKISGQRNAPFIIMSNVGMPKSLYQWVKMTSLCDPMVTNGSFIIFL